MERHIQAQEEIHLSDVFKTLFRKIKMLILVLLVGIIAGGALGFALDFNKYYYGGKLEFYVNPKTSEDEVGEKIYGGYGRMAMNDVIRLLGSQLFAEYLFLDEYGLPETTSSEELNQKIETVRASLVGLTLSPKELATIVDPLVNEWRMLESYKDLIKLVGESTQFSHTMGDDELNLTGSSFIIAEVAVLNDVAFAKDLFNRVKVKVVSYVEKNMYVPTDFVGTRCRKVTNLDQAVLLNESSLVESTVKYAAIVGALSVLLVAVVVLVKDSFRKTLKNPAHTMAQLDIPMLALIPQEQSDCE